MNMRIIGMKQLYRELKAISQAALQGHSFLVVRNSKPVFRIEPIRKSGDKRYSFADLKKIQFTSSDKNLSKSVDAITYKL